MKKILSVIGGALAFAVLATSCGASNKDSVGGNSGNSTNSGSGAADANKIACYIAFEPAASVKVAKTSLEFVGDLQELYGGNLGYPQAVLVAKSSFAEKYTTWTNNFMDTMVHAAEWLRTADAGTVVSAISAHLTEGLAPSLTVDNLTPTAVEHSGVWFEKAADCKDEVNGFLEKLIAVDPASAKAVADEFYYSVGGGDEEGDGGNGAEPGEGNEGEVPASVEIYMPDGAPALSMAYQMSQSDSKGVNYHVVAAATINTFVTGEAPKADLCVLPLNMAAKLLGTGETYKMLGAVTHGNLYMLSSDTSVRYTTENLSSLVGKTVGVVQLKNVPGLTFKVILNTYNIPWQELTGDVAPAADKVNLKPVTPEQVLPDV